MPSVVAEVGSSANQYQVLAKLAAGGMAEIFLARVASGAGVERYVVLKRILRERAHDTGFVQMFLEEARLAAQLGHPNVAQVYDVGRLGESYFFTMEYVHGETVRALIKRARALRRDLPVGVVLTVIAGAAAGLHHAHERLGLDGRPLGIVHRDVSPSNLMISYEGGVKVVDFGVAKAENRASETRSGAVKGKISYLSPEQCRTVPLDRRSDLFSLGIVAWEMLTGERLYRRASDFETMTAIVDEPPPPPSHWRPDLPRGLDELVLRLLAKEPGARLQTGDQLVEAIEHVAAHSQLALSTTALARFMRDLFGQRPEPWLEVEAIERGGEGGTLTIDPLPEVQVVSPVELQLARVRDLSHFHPGVESESKSRSHVGGRASTDPGAPIPRVTAPARPAALARDLAAPLPPTLEPAPDGSLGGATILELRPDMIATGTGSSSGVSMSGLSAPGLSMSGPSAGASTSYPGASPYPVMRREELAEVAPGAAPARRHLGLVAVAAGAVIVGVIIAFAVAAGDAPPAPAVATPAPGTGAPAPGAEAAPATLATAPVDAAPAAPAAPAPDAAVVVAAVDAGAALAAGSGAGSARPGATAAGAGAGAPRAPRADARAEIVRAYGEGKFADALAACEGVRERPLECALAACEAGDAARARAWSSKLAASGRTAVQATCKAHGIDLAPRVRPDGGKPPPAKPDCKADPMACQF